MKTKTKSVSSGKQPVDSFPKNAPNPQKAPPVPIVGIGASAGGLEALEQFLRHVPEKCGLAFVIIQHLDPTHKGIMPNFSSARRAWRCSRSGTGCVSSRTASM